MYEDRYYRGYVKVQDKEPYKTPAHKFGFDDPLHSWDDISRMPHAGGVLRQDIVMVDLDDPEQSERFIALLRASGVKCRIMRTTNGVHALFKDDGKMFPKNLSHELNAVGLTVDIKSGARSSFEVIKQHGEMREIIQECEEPDYPPKWLMLVKSDIDFYNMGEGDGRNNALYGYISTLGSKKYGFSEAEAFEAIRLMNNYVMKNPLDESELNVILREGAMPEGRGRRVSGGGDKFQHWTVGNELIEEYSIKRINGGIHIYKDGIYVPARNGWFDNILIAKDPTLTAAKRAEVIKYVEGKVMVNTKPTDARYIAFNNGLYDIIDGVLIDFTPDMILTNKINYDYVEDAYSELADKVLDKLACHDPAIRSLLEEVIGYTFYRRSELRKCFIFIGKKANGKSTFIAMINNVLGEDNTSALDLSELGQRFKTAELVGKLCNVGDDIGDEFIGNPAIFKKLVSGDRLNVEFKGMNPFDFNNYAKLIFSANSIPRIRDKSGAVLDRMIIVPFDATFSKNDEDYDPYIKYKLLKPDVMEYLIVLGVQGLKRVLENHGFTPSKRVDKELETYNEDNNPILLFFKDLDVETDLHNQPIGDVYRLYDVFCNENNLEPMGNSQFSKKVIEQFPELESSKRRVNGKQVRIFKKKETE